MRTTTILSIVSVLVLAVIASPSAGAQVPDSAPLREAVTLDGVWEHLEMFDDIAAEHGGVRSNATPGLEASMAYVIGQLEAAGYEPTVEEFTFPVWGQDQAAVFERLSPDPVTYALGEEFFTMGYSGSGDVTAPIEPVDVVLPPPPEPGVTSGCQAADFAAFPTGSIALIQRGACPYREQIANAEAAGAVGVVIFNEGQAGRQVAAPGNLGPPGATIPVVTTSFAIGRDLADLAAEDEVVVHLSTDTFVEERGGYNVLAETPGGRSDEVVVVGANVDAVAGPGINHNASGASVVLEIAQEMAELGVEPVNTVRFALWGYAGFVAVLPPFIPDLTLEGAQAYVAGLSDAERDAIAVYLDVDMVGSPNPVRFVTDSDGSDAGVAGPSGSGHIEQVLTDYFASQGLASEPTPLVTYQSDYVPFVEAGIPVGGLTTGGFFAGEDGLKTEREAEIYGGTAGAPYDPCQVQPCDTIENIDPQVLDQMADATAHAVHTLATDPVVPPCTIMGTPGDDRLRGTRGDDVICAGDGDDVVYPSAGSDVVHGDAGDDRLYGRSCADELHGGDGDDRVYDRCRPRGRDASGRPR